MQRNSLAMNALPAHAQRLRLRDGAADLRAGREKKLPMPRLESLAFQVNVK
jgi:hypothetical protein